MRLNVFSGDAVLSVVYADDIALLNDSVQAIEHAELGAQRIQSASYFPRIGVSLCLQSASVLATYV